MGKADYGALQHLASCSQTVESLLACISDVRKLQCFITMHFRGMDREDIMIAL